MNRASRVFNKFLACIFASFFALFFLIIVCIFLFRNMFTYDNVFEYVTEARVFDSESYEILSSGSSKTLRDSIQKDLLIIGIPESVTDSVLDSNEVNTALSKYIYSYYNYVLYNVQRISFDENKVILTIQNEYLASQGKALSDKQLDELKHYLNSLTNKLDSGLFSDSEINEFLNLNIVRMIASSLNSNYVLLLFGICLVLMVVLISICLHSLLKTYNWCSKMICLDGIILVIASLLEVKIFSMFFNSKGIVDNLIVSVVENGFTGLLICGIVLVIVGLILIVISGILLFRKSKTPSDKKLDDVVDHDNIVTSGVEKAQEDEFSNSTSEQESDMGNSYDSTDNADGTFNNDIGNEQDNIHVNADNDEITEPAFSPDIIDTENHIQEDAKDSDTMSDLENNEEKSFSELSNEAMEAKDEYDTEIVEDTDIGIDEDSDNTEAPDSVDVIEMETDIDSSDIDEYFEGEDSNSLEESEYAEIFDKDSKDEEIDKKDIELEPLTEISPDVVYPEKGKDIEVNLDETEEEEIEVL